MPRRIPRNSKSRGYIESLIGGRLENQDSAGAVQTPLGLAVVVCDGMGGTHGGGIASKTAVQTVINDLITASPEDSPQVVLENAIKHANACILEKGNNCSELNGMGTTITAIILHRLYAVVAHVGDSRVYQLRGRNKVFRTTDHSQVFKYVSEGIITEEQARTSAYSNVILRALGIGNEVDVEIALLPYVYGDRFVLCTDGFWGAMPEKEFIHRLTEPGDIYDNLKDLSNEIDCIGKKNGGNHDNLTAALVVIKSESKTKIKMTKAVKVIIASLSALLLLSIALNIMFISGKSQRQSPESIEVINHNQDTTQVTHADSTTKS